MTLDLFHPAVASWFAEQFRAPTLPQERAWPAIRSGRNVLISAPTGSGKTLAAFLSAIDDLVRQGVEGRLEPRTQVVYVSPLKALSNDIRKNLQEPLEGIAEHLERRGLPRVEVRAQVRTGDTPPSERQSMLRRPPHLLVTTPESLYILLTSEGGRRLLGDVRTVIVDEIHAVVADRRGTHLAVTLERLEALVAKNGRERLGRIGLSATQKPIEEVARFLVGTRFVSPDGRPDCHVVDTGHRRELDLAIEVPPSPLTAVMEAEVWDEVHARLAELIEQHRTTLVFVNTRRLAERLTRHLSERLGEGRVASHHGSMAKETRLLAEQRLKAGELSALVATASLELGIDIGDVDLACQIGSTRSIAALLQRVGRSGHGVDGLPKGRLFPLSRDELVECTALVAAVRRGDLDRLVQPRAPLDVLAQQCAAIVASEDEMESDELFELLRGAWPYRDLSRDDFEAVVDTLAHGYRTSRGRSGALLHHDEVGSRLRARRGARMAAITCGGTIPDLADYDVVLEPDETKVGTVDEDFAVESLAGDVFQLGNASWRILRIDRGRVRVADAAGQPPNIPFWFGEAPARTDELSEEVSRLRERVAALLPDEASARRALERDAGLSEAAATQLVEYLATGATALGVMPTQQRIVLERFFDESGGMQLVVHSPFGSRVNRAWGLALRKRFCRKFNLELQAAAVDDALVISLGQSHSFALEDVFSYLRPEGLRELLVQAVLDAPMFVTRFRWNATRSLALRRQVGGKRVVPQLQRMLAEDLVASVFPDQQACLENVVGDREVPDHPLVRQTIDDCLHEAMDFDAFLRVIDDVSAGRVDTVAVDLPEPSPLAAEILTARPYAFLDDAPLEERRTQAVAQRRHLSAEAAESFGALDEQAIATVREQAWPDPRDADELHDAALVLGVVTPDELERLDPTGAWRDELFGQGRLSRARPAAARDVEVVVAAERAPELRAIWPDATMAPEPRTPERLRREWPEDAALVELVRGRVSVDSPTTAAALARVLGCPLLRVEAALAALESEGYVLRGRFTPGVEGIEWSERGLLSRIQRATISKLRREIAPVTAADFLSFAVRWQRATPTGRASGASGLSTVLSQLSGWSAAAAAWEDEILPLRLVRYDPAWLDQLCLSGRYAWARGRARSTGAGGRSGPMRTTPISLAPRDEWACWGAGTPELDAEALSSPARAVLEVLDRRGASFLPELAETARQLPSETESALGELVAAGLVTCDGFAGLRSLLAPSRPGRITGRSAGRRGRSVEPLGTGRWARVSLPGTAPDGELAETVARTLLRRHGVVFRRLLEREALPVTWRELHRVLRRLEARGEVRGGRFVERFSGEQFGLPEAVGLLRQLRRESSERERELVAVSASDPLNLAGILTPGERVPALPGHRLLLRDGVPIATLEGKQFRALEGLEQGEAWDAEKLLRKRPPSSRSGRSRRPVGVSPRA